MEVSEQQQLRHEWRRPGIVFGLALALLGWTYRDTLVSMFDKWNSDASFSHGFVILPISLWLVWRKRADVAQCEVRPFWFGVLALLGLGLLWIIARGTGVLGLEQAAVVMMIPALVLALLGSAVARTLAFPLAYLIFMVPFGRSIVPWLMQVTADVSTLALQWTGVPILRSHMYITIPGGSFEVARACSGLNFVTTGLVLGVLFAHLSFRSWTKRLLCVAAFVVVPIIANGLRVYLTILVSHWTDMRYGPGAEHIMFGRIFFIAVLLAMFWIGRRWVDSEQSDYANCPSLGTRPATWSVGNWTTIVAAVVVLMLPPPYLASSVARATAALVNSEEGIALPIAASPWRGPVMNDSGWRPLYRGGLDENSATYFDASGAAVDVFVAVYGLGTTVGAEMISYSNVLYPDEHGSLPRLRNRSIAFDDSGSLQVHELVVPGATGDHLVWYWFMVGDRAATNPFVVKALEAEALVSRRADSERIVTIATRVDAEASARLQSFVTAHPTCVQAGFSSAGSCR